MKLTVLAAALLAASATAHEVDVLVAVEPSVVERNGIVAVHANIRHWLDVTNTVFGAQNTGIHHNLVKVLVLSEDAAGPSVEDGSWGDAGIMMASYVGLTQMQDPASELAEAVALFGADNVVYVVADHGDTSKHGHARASEVVSISYRAAGSDETLIAHELGHATAGLYDLTGEDCAAQYLMCGTTGSRSATKAEQFKPGELDKLMQVAAGTYPYFTAEYDPTTMSSPDRMAWAGWIAPEMPKLASVSLSAQTNVTEGGSLDVLLSLRDFGGAPTVLDEAVAVEVYAASGSATAETDFAAEPVRVEFMPGESEKSVSFAVIDDAAAEGAETFVVGARFGEKVATAGEITATIEASDNASGGGGGGGSFGWLSLAAMGLLLRWRRK